MKRKTKIALDIPKTALAVMVVAITFLLSLAIDEFQLAGMVPVWTVQLREVLVVWGFTFAMLGPSRTNVAFGNAAVLTCLALFVSSSVFAERSNLFSIAGMLIVLIPARLFGLRLSRNSGSSMVWRPSILQLFAITAASAGVFTLGRLTYQNEDTLIAEFVWPLLLGAMLSSAGLALLSNYTLLSRLLMTCLIVAPVAFVLAQPHRVDWELGAAVVAELTVTLGWSWAVFGVTHSCGWVRLSRKQDVLVVLPEPLIASSSTGVLN